MPLADHLRELRRRLVRAMLAIAAGGVVGWIYYHQIFRALSRPACELPSTIKTIGQGHCGVLTISGLIAPFSLQLEVAFMVGLVLASPIWLYQLWAFIAPGLHRNEKRWAVSFAAIGVPLFLVGAGLAYWLLPHVVPVLLHFTPSQVSNNVPIDKYLDFVIRLIVVFGLAFEIPLILVVANLAGLISAKRMASWWRWAIFLIFLFAAVATPTGDPFTMSALAVPLCMLYGLAILIARVFDSRRSRREREESESWENYEASPLDSSPEPVENPTDVDDVT
jgi:sec-independent protein translocase protein TatC